MVHNYIASNNVRKQCRKTPNSMHLCAGNKKILYSNWRLSLFLSVFMLQFTFMEEPYKSMAERESGRRSTKNSLFGEALSSVAGDTKCKKEGIAQIMATHAYPWHVHVGMYEPETERSHRTVSLSQWRRGSSNANILLCPHTKIVCHPSPAVCHAMPSPFLFLRGSSLLAALPPPFACLSVRNLHVLINMDKVVAFLWVRVRVLSACSAKAR